MNSRFFILVFTGLASLGSAEAKEIKNYPLGVILRPSLIQRFFDRMNQAKNGIPIDACLSEHLDIRITGTARVYFSNPAWLNATAEDLALSATTDRLDLKVKASSPCLPGGKKLSEETILGHGSVKFKKAVSLQYKINPWNLHEAHPSGSGVELEEQSIQSLVDSIEISIEELPNLFDELNRPAVKEIPIKSIVEVIDREFAAWLGTRLRGLAFIEYLSHTFEKADLWQEGVQIERGAISLSNPSERLRQSELAFGFYPRLDQFIVLGNTGLELYFNSVFLDRAQIDTLSNSPQTDARSKLAIVRDKLLFDPGIPDAKFSRPIVSEKESDVTLILPEALINGALQRLYQQDLKQFSTSIALGKQAKGLVADEAVDVSLRVQLESNQAPQILFESNRLNLKVSNYFLSIGTFIEDRLIPSTQVKAQVNVSASLDVSGPTVNLSIQPSTFTIGLEKGDRFYNQFTKGDLKFVEDVSNDLWKDFFVKYPQLPLFYTIFKTADSKIKITRLEVEDELVLLHFNFEEIKVEL